MTDSKVTKVTELIKAHMGVVFTSKKDVDAHSAVLVADEASSWDYNGDVFKLSYIYDCISVGKLLNIAHYLKDPPSKFYVENFNYMSVIYHRKYSWETIPPIYKLPNLAEDHPVPYREDSNDSDLSIDSIHSPNSDHSIAHSHYYKHTQQQYSREEREAMVRYVVEHELYFSVKGKKMYKQMEAANICPIRTWQSMRDHFLRYIVKEIPRYSFLTSDQKKYLQKGLHPYK